MTAQILFNVIIGIITFNFLLNNILNFINSKNFDAAIPKELEGVYQEDDYIKSQNYKKENFKFSTLLSVITFVMTIIFFYVEGFAYIDQMARHFSDNKIIITLLFFGIIMFGSDILTIPLSYYKTFVIEEKYGFNKSTKRLFILDIFRGWGLTLILGGSIMSLIVWFYQKTGVNFWLYTWLFIGLFSIFGSKRSTKANAYFTGFGGKKRIVLYDTLIKDLNVNEIVAVLAHEIGHYKRNHVVFNMSIFHIGLIAFGILYTPISAFTGLLMNILSRKFEYQADNYAKEHYNAEALISSLKKLATNSLSNLTPHKAYVFMYYSHPTLLQRIKNLAN